MLAKLARLNRGVGWRECRMELTPSRAPSFRYGVYALVFLFAHLAAWTLMSLWGPGSQPPAAIRFALVATFVASTVSAFLGLIRAFVTRLRGERNSGNLAGLAM